VSSGISRTPARGEVSVQQQWPNRLLMGLGSGNTGQQGPAACANRRIWSIHHAIRGLKADIPDKLETFSVCGNEYDENFSRSR
jgi:hypothetical protein